MQTNQQQRKPFIALDDAVLSTVRGGEAPTALETTTIG